MPHPAYGADGLLGCATPQGNPTVEPELRRLLPSSVNLLVTRSTASGGPRERLLAYFDQLDRAIESFGGLPLDAFGFACTASSYLLDRDREAARCSELEERFGIPLRTAAGAVERALVRLGAERLLLASPYPAWIHEACRTYWRNRGYQVVGEVSAQPDMIDTTAIYDLDPESVARRFEAGLSPAAGDVLLVTGTGLPTLPIRRRLASRFGVPVLSANLCLAWDLLEAVHPGGRHTEVLWAKLLDASA